MLPVNYAIFAAISTLVNLATQMLFFYLFSSLNSIFLGMVAGTATGLLTKYELDKRYIFEYKATNLKDEGRTFFLYSFVGVFTTLIFWGFEIGFDFFFNSAAAKYVGGALGLSIGYLLKYKIDKKFVFKSPVLSKA